MRIIHLIFALNTGGSETMLVDLLNEQVKTHDVSIIIINRSFDEELKNQIDKNVNIIFLNRIEKSKSILPVIKLNWFLFKIKPNVIHCHQHSLVKMILYKKNVILTLHTLNIPVTNLKKYDKVFAISNAVKDDIKKRADIPVMVIHNGVNTERINIKTEFLVNNYRIVQISRLDHKVKGQDILIKALDLLIKEGFNFNIDFIGAGDSQSYLIDLVGKLNLNNQIRFLGGKSRKFVYSHLKEYDLLVQPSIIEGFGLTIAEALVAKVPVLISDIQGPMEIIDGGKFGTFFKKGDSYDCAKKIKEIFKNYDNYRKQANSASEIICQKYSIKRMSNSYINKYE